MKNTGIAIALFVAVFSAHAEVQIINGVKYECTPDGICQIVEEGAPEVDAVIQTADEAPSSEKLRIGQGYMDVEEFLGFLDGVTTQREVRGKALSIWMILAAILAGLAMNLSPCVLPMIPVNLMIIGKSPMKGALYGLGISVAYGVLGLLAALGAVVFGEIQANPWFNVAIAVLFIALALSMMGVFVIDFSKYRGSFASKKTTMLPSLFAFFMGVVCAVLAGACVAPVLVATLLLTADLVAAGYKSAVILPFTVGFGMALPWPFAAAGMKCLPKPGAWMGKVNKIFGAFVMLFALYYVTLAYRGFFPAEKNAGGESMSGIESVNLSSPHELAQALEEADRPILVDCWASWCKNCSVMDKTTFADKRVIEALQNYTVIRLRAEDIRELKKLPGLDEIRGLPAFIIYEEE